MNLTDISLFEHIFTHCLQLVFDILPLFFGQVQATSDFVDFIVDIVVKLFIEFELNILVNVIIIILSLIAHHHVWLRVHLVHVHKWIILTKILWSHVLLAVHLRHVKVLILHLRHSHQTQVWNALELVLHILNSCSKMIVWNLP